MLSIKFYETDKLFKFIFKFRQQKNTKIVNFEYHGKLKCRSVVLSANLIEVNWRDSVWMWNTQWLSVPSNVIHGEIFRGISSWRRSVGCAPPLKDPRKKKLAKRIEKLRVYLPFHQLNLTMWFQENTRTGLTKIPVFTCIHTTTFWTNWWMDVISDSVCWF